jgi:hypothetical protein
MQDYNRLNHQLKARLSSLHRCLQNTWTKFSTFLCLCTLQYSTLFHLSPLRFHYVGGCWDWRTVATSALAVTRNHSARSHPICARSHPLSARSHPLSARSHPHSDRSHPHSARSHALSTWHYSFSKNKFLTVRFKFFFSAWEAKKV